VFIKKLEKPSFLEKKIWLICFNVQRRPDIKLWQKQNSPYTILPVISLSSINYNKTQKSRLTYEIKHNLFYWTITEKRHLMMFGYSARRIFTVVPQVTGKGWQDVLTPPGWPLWRTTTQPQCGRCHWAGTGQTTLEVIALNWCCKPNNDDDDDDDDDDVWNWTKNNKPKNLNLRLFRFFSF